MRGVLAMAVGFACVAVLALAMSATAQTRLDKRTFVRKGNAICKSYYKRLNALPTPTSTQELVTYLKQARILAVAETRALAALVPPKPSAKTFAKLLATGRAETAALPDLIGAVESGDKQRTASLEARIQALDKRYNALANSIGLTVCGQPTSG